MPESLLEWEVQYRQYFANAAHWGGVGNLPYGVYDLAASRKHETPEIFAQALVRNLHARDLLPKGDPGFYRIAMWGTPGDGTPPILAATWDKTGKVDVRPCQEAGSFGRRYWRSLTGSRREAEVVGRGRAGARRLLDAEPPQGAMGSPLEIGATAAVWHDGDEVTAIVVGFRVDEWGEHAVLELADGTEVEQRAHWQTEA